MYGLVLVAIRYIRYIAVAILHVRTNDAVAGVVVSGHGLGRTPCGRGVLRGRWCMQLGLSR